VVSVYRKIHHNRTELLEEQIRTIKSSVSNSQILLREAYRWNDWKYPSFQWKIIGAQVMIPYERSTEQDGRGNFVYVVQAG